MGSVFAATTLMVFVIASGAEGHSDKRSNIILILTDDQDWTLGSMKAMPKTHKLFGNHGTRFTNGFVTSPICCPSRASILTGQYAHNHKVSSNVEGECYSLAWINGPEKQTVGKHMKDAGYKTAYFGKYINSYRGKLVPGWDEWMVLQGNSKYYNYTLVRYNSKQNFTYLERHEDSETDYFPTVMTHRALRHMQKVMMTKPRKPLFLVLSYPSPHGSEEADFKYQHKHLQDTAPRTVNFNNGTYGKHWFLQNSPPLSKTQVEFIDVLYRRRLQTLYSVDDAIQELFLRLWLMNTLSNSYVFLTSDHGYHLGQFGALKGKGLPYEDDIRVPFFAIGPRIPKRRTVTDIVLNIDLTPTFIDIAEAPVPETMDGVSILKLFDTNGTNPQWRTSFLIEQYKGIRNQMAETALSGAVRKVETNPNANTLPPIFNKPLEQEFSNGSLLDTCFDQYRQHKANSELDALKAAYYRQVDLSKCLKKSQLSHCRKNGEEGCTLPVCPDLPTVSNAVKAPSAQCMQLLRERQCVVPKLKCAYYNKDVWKTEPKYKGGSFCRCSGASNNSFWCERRIEENENYLYCVFMTHFEEYYNLDVDPFQLENLAYGDKPVLNPGYRGSLLQRLRRHTECKGAASCNNAGRPTERYQ